MKPIFQIFLLAFSILFAGFPFNSGALHADSPLRQGTADLVVRDDADVLPLETVRKLRAILPVRPTPPIWIVTANKEEVSPGLGSYDYYLWDLFDNLGLDANPDIILILYYADNQQFQIRFGSAYPQTQKYRIRTAVRKAFPPLLQDHDHEKAHINVLTALIGALPEKRTEKSPLKFSGRAVNAPPSVPYGTWGAATLLGLILGGGFILSYRKSTALRRARAARIAAYKKRWRNRS